MDDESGSDDAENATFWLVDGDVAMLDKGSRSAMRFFAKSGWKPVPAFSIEEERVEITEAELDARLDAARKALKAGQ